MSISNILISDFVLFENDTINYGTVQTAEFRDNALNSGTVLGDALFKNSASNSGVVSVSAFFADSSTNAGTIHGDAIFDGSAANLEGAIVIGIAKVAATATNNGTAGSVEVYDPNPYVPADAYAAWLAGGGDNHYTTDGYDVWAYQGTVVANQDDYNASVAHGGVWSVAEAAVAAATGRYNDWMTDTGDGHYTGDIYDIWAYNHAPVADQNAYNALVASAAAEAAQAVIDRYNDWMTNTGDGHYTGDTYDIWAYNHAPVADQNAYNALVASAAATGRYNDWMTNTGDGHYTGDIYDIWAYNHAPVADQNAYNALVATAAAQAAADAAAAQAAAAAAAEAQAVINRYNDWMTNTGDGNYTGDTYNIWAYNHAPVADQNAYNALVYANSPAGRYDNAIASAYTGHYTADDYDVYMYGGVIVAAHDYTVSVAHGSLWSVAQAADAYAAWLSGGGNGHYTTDGLDKWAYYGTECDEAAYNAAVAAAAGGG